MKLNYPIKFEPILHQKIWGGEKLKEQFSKKTEKINVGESWEISAVEGNVSVVENGVLEGKSIIELIHKYKADFLGKKIYETFGDNFPLLIKYIDAKENLSIQLHPNDELSRERHDSFGKTEMWYVMDADEGAELNVGFNQEMTQNSYLEALNSGKILEVLNFEKVKKGDSFFIKEGLVHAIGAGCMIAEIQQTSDITYRIYDWDRVDDEGNSRELHTELALDAIDYHYNTDYHCTYDRNVNQASTIASCNYFTTNYIGVEGAITRNLQHIDCFKIYMCVEGEGAVTVDQEEVLLKAGEVVLIPAIIKSIKLNAFKASFLEVYI